MKLLYFLLFAITISSCHAQDNPFFDVADSVFSTYVKDGKVDYAAIKKDRSTLDKALSLAKDFKVAITRPDRYKAFWINAYNLAVFKQVVDNYPIKSPQDVEGFFDKKTFNLAGKELTLNDIENTMLRKKFPEEARFHFVLVCAGLGCPPIIDKAYRPETLDEQLQQQAVLSLNNPNFIKVKGDDAAVSMIFKWYAEDFKQQGGVVSFINKFRKEQLPKDISVTYYPYDWDLNKTY